jgi:hypothetical protein
MKNHEDLLRKLKALAEGGVGGEKVNAEAMLQKLLKKYNIDPDSLNDEALNFVEFKYKKGLYQSDLLLQIIASVIPTLKRKNGKYASYIKVDVTRSEEIEIRAKYDFYSKKLKEDFDLFFTAFFHRNNLYYHGESDSKDDSKPMDHEKIQKIVKMMNGLDQHQYRLQIGYARGERS